MPVTTMHPIKKQEMMYNALAIYKLSNKALYGVNVKAPISKLTEAQKLGLYSPRQTSVLVTHTELNV